MPTRDGWICLSANTNQQVHAFFDAIGRPELKADPRFATVPARFANVADFFRIRMEALKTRTTAEWMEILDRADVPAMPYHTLDGVLADPHLKDIRFFEIRDHPTEGKTRNMRLPNKWSCGVRKDWNPAPKLGQHSVEILREAGYTEGEVERMLAAGVTLDGRIARAK
jgi:crotonobetainyl-CoA:carnitine CoA-transferase CaiB-like acyl-CoA transferase